MNPNITVLITVRNSKDIIRKCIDSILKLNYPKNRYKILVIDAFSTDGTFEILQNYGNKIVLKRLEGKPPKAYNYALNIIKTEFTAITNADCIVDKNWLKEIIKPFEDKQVMAVAGIAKNPIKTTSKLQSIIGRELEDRYNHFPREITRAPEMNLCLRTSIARKLKFDEKLDVSYDADFGYRLTSKYGKIIYQSLAIIYHYHRASWKGFFKQQFTYAKFVPRNYLKKHLTKIKGDEISKTSFVLQILFIYLIFLGLLSAMFNLSFLYFPITIFSFLLISYLIDIIKLSRSIDDIFWFLILFIVRNIAWSIGIPIGVINMFKN